jgi:antitoxin component YwqK of YwqJK toxin-antitoxin module
MKAYQTITLKQIIVLLVMIIVSYGCGVRQSQLQERNGLFYKINSETPYSGRMVDTYPNGQKKKECTYKAGKIEGAVTAWYENGKRKGSVPTKPAN